MSPLRCSNFRPALISRHNVRRVSNRADARPRVLVLGSGWAGFSFARRLDTQRFSVALVSQRNHFVLTPLLPGTAVGTLDFRAVVVPNRRLPGVQVFQASLAWQLELQTVRCVTLVRRSMLLWLCVRCAVHRRSVWA